MEVSLWQQIPSLAFELDLEKLPYWRIRKKIPITTRFDSIRRPEIPRFQQRGLSENHSLAGL